MISATSDNWVSNPSENNGPLLSITVWCLTAVAAAFMFLRLFIRQSQGKLWLDDFVLGISWVRFLFPSKHLYLTHGSPSSCYKLCSSSLPSTWVLVNMRSTVCGYTMTKLVYALISQSVNYDHIEYIAYYGAAGLSLSIVATALSKISFGVTLLRLTDDWPRRYVYFAMTTLAIFAIPATIMPWVQCKPVAKTFVDILPGMCINKGPTIRYARFQASRLPRGPTHSSQPD